MNTHGADQHGHGSRDIHSDKLPVAAGIQADKPLPPWELPDAFRLDCEPHRGRLLSRLATACVGMSIALAPVTFPLGLTTWLLARRDLAQMRRGLRDPAGEQLTAIAKNGAVVASALSGMLGLPLWWAILAIALQGLF